MPCKNTIIQKCSKHHACLVAQSCLTLWDPMNYIVHQAPLSMEFSRQEFSTPRIWSGLPFPTPGDLPDPGIEPTSPVSPALQAHPLPTEPSGKPTYAPQSGQKKVPKGAPLSYSHIAGENMTAPKERDGPKITQEVRSSDAGRIQVSNYPTCIPAIQPLSRPQARPELISQLLGRRFP